MTVKEGRRGRTSQLQNDPISFPVLSPHRAFDKSAMADAVSVTSDLRVPPHPVFSTFRAAPASQLPLPKAVRRAEITILVVAGVRPVRTTARADNRSSMWYVSNSLQKSSRQIQRSDSAQDSNPQHTQPEQLVLLAPALPTMDLCMVAGHPRPVVLLSAGSCLHTLSQFPTREPLHNASGSLCWVNPLVVAPWSFGRSSHPCADPWPGPTRRI